MQADEQVRLDVLLRRWQLEAREILRSIEKPLLQRNYVGTKRTIALYPAFKQKEVVRYCNGEGRGSNADNRSRSNLLVPSIINPDAVARILEEYPGRCFRATRLSCSV